MTQAIHNSYKPLDGSCSCANCDSRYCFMKRRYAESCSCENCTEPKTCLFYSNRLKLNESHSGAINTAHHAVSSATGDNVHTPYSHAMPSRYAHDTAPPRYNYDDIPVRHTHDAMTNTVALANTAETARRTSELVKNILGTSKDKIQALKTTYLSQKPKHDVSSISHEQLSYKSETEDYRPQKSGATEYTINITKSVVGSQKGVIQSLKNIYLPKKKDENCDCTALPKHVTKSAGYVMDLKTDNKPKDTKKSNECQIHILDRHWNTIETPGNKYMSNTCECSDCLRNVYIPAPDHYNPPGYVLELPKKEYPKKKCVPNFPAPSCDQVAKNVCKICSSADKKPKNKNETQLSVTSETKSEQKKKTKHDLCKHILELHKHTLDTLDSIYSSHKRMIESQASVKSFSEHQCKCESTNTHEKSKTKEKKVCNCNKIEAQKNEGKLPKDLVIKCDCGKAFTEHQKDTFKPTHIMEDIFQKQRNTIKNLKNEIMKCDANDDEFMDTPSNKSPDIHKCKKNPCDCSESTKTKSGGYKSGPGDDNYHKKICECNDSSKSKSESPGYVFELPESKIKQQGPGDYTYQKKKCKCSELEKNKAQHEPINKTQVYSVNRLETHNPYKTTNSCECNESRKNKAESPGYVFELPGHKTPPNCVGDNIHQKKKCECSESEKTKSESPGYVFELPKYKSTAHGPGDTKYQKTNCECESKNKRESAGYVFEVPKHQKANCECIEPVNKPPEHNICQKNPCNCNELTQNKQLGYALEVPKHKPIPNGPGDKSYHRTNCECNESTKKPPEYHICTKNPCDCSESTKNKTSGYTFEVPKSKPIPNGPGEKSYQKTKCECNESVKKPQEYHVCTKNPCDCSESTKDKPSGYIFEVPKSKPIPNGPGDKSYQKTKCECNDSTKKPPEYHVCTKDPCDCSESTKKKPSGYVFDVPKSQPNGPEDKSYQKSKCECNESVKKSQEYHVCTKNPCDCSESTKKNPPGYIFEVPKSKPIPNELGDNTYQKKNCECNASTKNKTESPGYVFELPKHKTGDKKGCECSAKNKEESPGYVFDLPKPTAVNRLEVNNTNQKDSCGCNASRKNKSESAGYVFDLPKYKPIPHGPGNNEFQKKSCECSGTNDRETESPGYVFDMQKNINNTQKLSKNMLETNKDGCPKTDCVCQQTPQNPTTEIFKDMLESQTRTIDMLKKVYLPQTHKEYECPDTAGNDAHGRKDISSGTAMLSAEVMDMPYREFNDSLACKHPDLSEKPSKLTKYDIFNRIKEAYKACSCKVCECIVGKAKADTCKCKPCECNECKGYDTKTSKDNVEAAVGTKCTCALCNRSQCPRFVYENTKQPACECRPCDCVKCVRSITKLCDCEPCQCVECKPKNIHQPQTLVVAPVGENVQRVACTCSPCDCIECGLVYPLASSVGHEMSTGTNRHMLCRCEICLNEACDQSGVDSCKCERRNKVMNKPVERDTHDFDIRTVIVQNKSSRPGGKKRSTRYDTIAMFAALPNTYPTFTSKTSRLSSTKTCTCEDCECITCISKENAINSIKSSQLFASDKTKTISDHPNIRNKSKLNTTDKYNCKLCQCQICKKQRDCLLNNQVSTARTQGCMCDTCDCLHCEHRSYEMCECTNCRTKIAKDCYEESCRCSVCKCEACERGGTLSCHQHSNNKKGDYLTPSAYKTKVNNFISEKRTFDSTTQKMTSNNDSNSIKPGGSIYHVSSKDYSSEKPFEFYTSLGIGSKTQANLNGRKSRIDKFEILKCDAYMQCQERNRGKSLHKNMSLDNEISGSYFSGYSSFETSPKTSCHKDYDSITPLSQNKNASWESCNSSGHDYPEYLIQFPKSTVETCLKDVMEFDMDNTIKLDKFNMIPNRNAKPIDMTEYDNIKLSGKAFQEYEEKDSSYSKIIATERTDSIKQYTRKTYLIGNKQSDHIPCNYNFSENVLLSRNYKIELNNSLLFKSQNNSEENKSMQNNKDSMSSFKQGDENKKHDSLIQDFNELQVARKVFDFNIAREKSVKSLLPTQNNESYSTWKYSKEIAHPSFLNSLEFLNIDEDNKRIQKTLKEAKEFSLELMRLLEMYEKANIEFESTSEKFKVSHASLFSGDFNGKNVVRRVQEDFVQKCFIQDKRLSEIQQELPANHFKHSYDREKKKSISVLQDRSKTLERNRFFVSGENNNSISRKLKTCKDVLDSQNFNESIAEKGSCHKMNSESNNIFLERIETHLKNEEECYVGGSKEQIYENNEKRTQKYQNINTNVEPEASYHGTEEIATVSDKRRIRKKERTNSKNYKKYSKLLKRTIIISKRISIKKSNINVPTPVIKYRESVGTSTTVMPETDTKTISEDVKEENVSQENKKQEINQIMQKLDTVFKNIEEIPVSASTDTNGLEKGLEEYESENPAMCNEVEEIKPWPILKKNYWNTRPYTKSKEVCIFPSLELEIKQAVQSISLQTTQPKKKIVPYHENKALANLQLEVKKLLDMPILQAQNTNYLADNPFYSNKMLNIQHKGTLQLELKDTPELALQPYCIDAKKLCYKDAWNRQTDKNPEDRRDYQNLPMLQPVIRKQIEMKNYDNNTTNYNNTTTRTSGTSGKQTNCEGLKVGFMVVRRVSDHTVLLKWNVPRDLTKVKGYELLVDGRAVQKIFSPSKSMAVVTCLPHTDKVLLTIRTITSFVSMTGHYPATTIIYRPRVRSVYQ